MPDAHANLAYSQIAVAPVPALTGLSLTVSAGNGALFPTAPFNATVWPSAVNPISSNAEIIRVTAVVGDVLTIVRAQEGTAARAIIVGDQIANTITVKSLTDIETSVSALNVQVATNSAQMTSADNALSAAVNVVSNAVSAETVNRISADNVLSLRLDSAETVLSNQGSAIVANSAQMTSADNALSAAINVVSNAASNALSVANAVSNRLSTWTLDNLANVSAPAPTDQQALVFNSAQGQWIASTIAAGAGSVTSAELQAVSAAAASADNTLSARIDSAETVISNQGSAIVANSAQMTSADNALSAAINVVSNAASNALSVANAVSNRLSTWTLDNLANVSVPAPTDQQALVFNSAQAQWVASTITAGAGSVTSAEVADIASGLSVRINSVNTVVSNQGSAIAANSAQMTSADNALSAAVNVVSNAVSIETADRISADNVLSARIDSVNTVVSNQGSAIVANSAQMTSADLFLASNIGSVSARLDAEIATRVGNDLSIAARVDSVNTVVSNQGSAIVANSAKMTSVDNVLSAAINAVSNQLSSWTLDNLANVSAPAPGNEQVLTFNSAANQWVASTITAGVGSVTSTELSAVSAAAASADATLSGRIDSVNTVVSNQGSAIVANSAQMTSADNVFSAAIDVISTELPLKRVLAGDQLVTATAPTSLSGFTFTCSANVSYTFRFQLYVSSPISLAGPKVIISTPGTATTRFLAEYMYTGGIANPTSIVVSSNNTVQYTTVSAVGLPRTIRIEGGFVASANGTLGVAVGNNITASTAASAITFLAGSYGLVWRMG